MTTVRHVCSPPHAGPTRCLTSRLVCIRRESDRRRLPVQVARKLLSAGYATHTVGKWDRCARVHTRPFLPWHRRDAAALFGRSTCRQDCPHAARQCTFAAAWRPLHTRQRGEASSPGWGTSATAMTTGECRLPPHSCAPGCAWPWLDSQRSEMAAARQCTVSVCTTPWRRTEVDKCGMSSCPAGGAHPGQTVAMVDMWEQSTGHSGPAASLNNSQTCSQKNQMASCAPFAPQRLPRGRGSLFSRALKPVALC